MFADISIISLPLLQYFTYSIPIRFREKIEIGSRVLIPFGNRKIVIGIVASIYEKKDISYYIKEILTVLDQKKIIHPTQFSFFEWIANYYCCSLGEVIKAALPTYLTSLDDIYIKVNSTISEKKLNSEEIEFIEKAKTYEHKSLKKATSDLFKNKTYKIFYSLIEKEVILLYGRDKTKKLEFYKLKEKYIGLSIETDLFSFFKKKPAGKKAIDFFINQPQALFTKKELLKHRISIRVINQLVEKEIIELIEKEAPSIPKEKNKPIIPIKLTEAQEIIKKEINTQFEKNKPVLFHGITGSGKTEVYIDLLNSAIQEGYQVLLLLPEIAITTQMVNRLEKSIEGNIMVYHSKINHKEKIKLWNTIENQKVDCIIGTRSAILLPFTNLGLIIIDEEHDNSYKQQDPAPRYHARDCALFLSTIHHSKILLGSATPSLESFLNTLNKKYTNISLDKRYTSISLPHIEIVDMLKERKERKKTHSLSHQLIQAIENALEKKEQIILFQNRRGYASYISCENCGWVATCKNCDVSLTYHLQKQVVECHYCGYTKKTPHTCESCGSNELKAIGLGTEKIEEEVSILFPQARVQRMDLDTIKTKNGYEKMIHELETGKIDILIGTQLVSKGFDFDKISVVGILDIDSLLHFPTFRAHEKAIQTIIQVSGRSGRRNDKGNAIIQTRSANHPILKYIKEESYISFLKNELEERKKFSFPPYVRMIQIIVKNKNKSTVEEASQLLLSYLNEKLNKKITILGPSTPMIPRIKNLYIKELSIKVEKTIDSKLIKQEIQKNIQRIYTHPIYKNTKCIIIVDPS